MTANGWFQIGLYLLVIALVTKPMGVFMTRVFNREKTFLDPIFRPIERLIYRLTGIDEKREMRWTEYAIAMLLFSGVSMALLYLTFGYIWSVGFWSKPLINNATIGDKGTGAPASA